MIDAMTPADCVPTVASGGVTVLDEPLARRPAWRFGYPATPEDAARRAREAQERRSFHPTTMNRIDALEAEVVALTEQHLLDRGRLDATMDAVADLRRQLDQHLGEKWGHRP